MDRRIAVATAAGVGALAGANRLLSRRAIPLKPPLGPDTGIYRWRGMDIGYTEGGDPERPDVLLLHDLHRAGSSREFVHIFDHLAENYHVIAPDFPGFGRSDRPPVQYSSELYQSFITDLVDDLTDKPTSIASSLAGAIVADAAEDVAMAKLLLVCPRATTTGRNRGIAGRLYRLPLLGTAATNLHTARFAIRWDLGRHRIRGREALSSEDLSYFWQSAHQPGARFAIGSMLAGDLDSTGDIGSLLEGLSVPTTLLWGRDADSPGVGEARNLAERVGAKLVVIDRSGTWPHYQQPEPFLSLVADELARVTGG